MQRLTVVEGQPLDVDPRTAQGVRDRLGVLGRELRPRIPFLAGADARPVIQNLVGTVQVRPGLALDVQPKTHPGDNWPVAIVDLLTDERAVIDAPSRRAQRAKRVVLADVLAARYAEVLDRAIRREGPLLLLERHTTERPPLAGRLDVSTWVLTRVLHPGRFPQAETIMTVDNPFTSALAWVAEALAIRCTDTGLAVRLRHLATRLRPGLPPHAAVDPGVAVQDIPAQWRGYQPAWTIACSVIRRISPIHRQGSLEGFGMAVEPWPLLERLLVRSLRVAAQRAREQGDYLRARGHNTHPLLDPMPSEGDRSLKRLHAPRAVQPDGSLWRGSKIVATFEAKYSRASSATSFRSHYFQALTTAAALKSPLAVLVYPEPSAPVAWHVRGFEGHPGRLIAIGLDMYGYEMGGERERGALLHGLTV